MKCKDAIIMISMEHDGEISESERFQLSRHVLRCESCAREREMVSSLSETLHAWRDEVPSEWLIQSFKYKLAEMNSEKRIAPRRTWAWGAGISAVAAIFAIAGLLLHTRIAPVTTVAQNPSPAVSIPHVEIHTVPNRLPSRPTKRIVVAKTLDREAVVSVAKPRLGHLRHSPAATMSAHKPHMVVAKATVPTESMHFARQISSGSEREHVINKLSAARKAKQETAIMVASKIDDAEDAMNQTVEKVRGTLRRVSYVLAESSTDDNNASDSQGGSSL